MRIADYVAFCLRAAVLAVLCTLALAASAYADESTGLGTPPATGETQGQGPVEGQNPGSEGPSGSPGGGAPGEGEGAGTGAGGTVDPPPPPKEEVSEPAAPPPATEPTSDPVVVVAEQAPQEAAKDEHLAGAGEEGLEGVSADSAHLLATDSGTLQGAKATGGDEAAQESQAIIAGPLSLPPTAPTAGATEAQASTTPLAGSTRRPALTAAQRAGSLSCELSALGGRTTDNCTVGWLGGKRYVESSTVGFSPAAGSLAAAATGGVPPDGGHGGSAVGNAPANPSPGPAPGGASGAAVGGGGGVAPSAFLSLAGLLLLAAPRAQRRLRLSSRPWLTACFVLIPERPG